jgi:hypothetical protein
MINIATNYFKQNLNKVSIVGEKELILKDEQEKVKIPHLNIKGIVTEIGEKEIKIKLSDYSKEYLETEAIVIKDDSFSLEKNQRVFIKFNDISIDGKKLNYSSVELYKYLEKIDIINEFEDYFTCDNDYGGELKIYGVSFSYNGEPYFENEIDLSENNEMYYINVKDGKLLVEELKSNTYPFKMYNMINPQETKYFDIIEIYKNK